MNQKTNQMANFAMVDNNNNEKNNRISKVVSVGSMHQGVERFGQNAGTQCTAMAASFIVFKSIFGLIRNEDIDNILIHGNEYFSLCKSHRSGGEGHRYIDSPELYKTFKAYGSDVKIEVTWLGQEYFHFDIDPSIEYATVATMLSEWTNRYPSHDKVGFIFTFLEYSLGFWCSHGKWYLSNSHAVNEQNINSTDGLARIFECSSLNDLVILLFINRPSLAYIERTNGSGALDVHNGRAFELFSVSVEVSSNSSNIVQDSNVRKVGRPKKKRRGPKPGQKGNVASVLSSAQVDDVSQEPDGSDLDMAVTDPKILKTDPLNALAVARYKEKNPKIQAKYNRKYKKDHPKVISVIDKRYREKNPETRQETVQNYLLNNTEARKESVQKYLLNNSDARQESVQNYLLNNSEARQESVQKYLLNNSEARQESVQKYLLNNSEARQESVQNYLLNNSDARQESVQNYLLNNSEARQQSVQKYLLNNSEARQESVQNYLLNNSEARQESVQKYLLNNSESRQRSQKDSHIKNASNRYLPRELQRYEKIGMIPKNELGVVPLFKLKSLFLNLEENKCRFCSANFFYEEKQRTEWCCRKGALNVPALQLRPLNASFYKEREFIQNSRRYNNLFAFSAIGTSGGFSYPEGGGVSMVTVNGRIYHRIFDLSYNESVNNVRLYIDDGEERRRVARDQGINVNQGILSEIEAYINEVNPFVTSLKRLAEMSSRTANIVFRETSRSVDGPVLGENPLPANADSSAQRCREVCAIVNHDQQPYEKRTVVVFKIGENRPRTVDLLSSSYETLQYPLIFPHGDAGWSLELRDCKNRKITQLQYYQYRILADPRFTSMGRLSAEYQVDMSVRMEEERLEYLELKQKRWHDQLRIAQRNEIDQDETIVGDNVQRDIGRIFLPATYVNSPRYFMTKYKDAMAVVDKLGNISFFITMTCNPKWDEIRCNLASYESASDRADLCCRVFDQKKAQLIRLLSSGRVFGPLDYIFSTVEFQKRGLPHVHICLRVSGGGPITNTEIDNVVSATIPLESEDSRLRALVLQHMVHGPCRRNLCIDANSHKCSKFFPKQQSEVSHINDKGFIIYKRDPFNTAEVQRVNQSFETNDTMIVPYNPVLLKYFDCHINVEIATSRKSVKYLFKYINKGPDNVSVAISGPQDPNGPPINEIENFRTLRYISSSEALWRIFSFDISTRKPPVECLPLHLPGRDSVTFRPGQASEAAERSVSKLDVYLRRPRTAELETLTYCRFHELYTEVKNKNTINRGDVIKISGPVEKFLKKRDRQGNLHDCVARIFWVSPNRGEQYFLRILLIRYPCYDLNDLKKVNGTVHSNFQQACIALGLVQNEDEYVNCMKEARTFMMANRLRRFLCLLINIGAPAEYLWRIFREDLCEDFLRTLDRDRAFIEGLRIIDRILRNQGSSNVEHGLETVTDNTTELTREQNRWVGRDHQVYHEEWIPKLNEKQRELFEHIVGSVVNNSESSSRHQKLVFVDGAAGTGKTLVISVVTSYLRSKGYVVLCTATSGIAALNHEGGMTAHSMFKLPLDVSDPSVIWNLSESSERADLIRSSALIVFDEVAMAHKNLLHCLDRSLRSLMDCNEPMGGKVFVSLGDFRQIGPIIPYGQPSDVVQASLRNSYLWPLMKVISLTAALRTRDDVEYTSFLSRVGDDLVTKTMIDGQSLIPLENIRFVTEVTELIDIIYPSHILQDPDLSADRAILSATYVDIREINSIIINRLSGDKITVYSADSLMNEQDGDAYFLNTESLNLIKKPGVPDHMMEYKIGCVCIILRNISFEEKLCNGTKVIIVGKSGPLIQVRKPHQSEIYLIPRIDFTLDVNTSRTIRITMVRKAYPLLPSFALSINRSQGQSISYLGVQLSSDVFTHGMLYVALSRVRARQNIVCLVSSSRVLNNVAYTKNIVFSGLRL